jgi:hypothetical protein
MAFSENAATQPVDRLAISSTDGFFGKTCAQGAVYVCHFVELQPVASKYLPAPENITGRIILKVDKKLSGPDVKTLALPYHALSVSAMYDPVFHQPYWVGKLEPNQEFLVVVQFGKSDPACGPLDNSDGYATDAIALQSEDDTPVEEAAAVLRIAAMTTLKEKQDSLKLASRDARHPLLANYATISIATEIAPADPRWAMDVLTTNCSELPARVYDNRTFESILATLVRYQSLGNLTPEQRKRFYETLGTLVLSHTKGALPLLASHLNDADLPTSKSLWNSQTIAQLKQEAIAALGPQKAEGQAAAKVLGWLDSEQ